MGDGRVCGLPCQPLLPVYVVLWIDYPEDVSKALRLSPTLSLNCHPLGCPLPRASCPKFICALPRLLVHRCKEQAEQSQTRSWEEVENRKTDKAVAFHLVGNMRQMWKLLTCNQQCEALPSKNRQISATRKTDSKGFGLTCLFFSSKNENFMQDCILRAYVLIPYNIVRM